MGRWAALGLFLLLVVGGGLAIGAATVPGAWYAGLAKPSFNPPGWVFGPTWAALYVLIAVAGWRVWLVARGSLAMAVWWVQLALNFTWSPSFFAAHQIGIAMGVIVALLVAIGVFIAAAWHRERVAALLLVPYLLWVGFATLLNGAILGLN